MASKTRLEHDCVRKWWFLPPTLGPKISKNGEGLRHHRHFCLLGLIWPYLSLLGRHFGAYLALLGNHFEPHLRPTRPYLAGVLAPNWTHAQSQEKCNLFVWRCSFGEHILAYTHRVSRPIWGHTSHASTYAWYILPGSKLELYMQSALVHLHLVCDQISKQMDYGLIHWWLMPSTRS